ncbi:M48 family metalloprotease [Nocardia sp. NBC_01327]|uniref:M48 family metalloprotease n=1 Tax=Nocardia sp. NBC_01327 TaxID=2903593 RepID=UPI002E13D0F6|nr:M48 family metalloprotease [Nocardia sp. NBC_01327]
MGLVAEFAASGNAVVVWGAIAAFVLSGAGGFVGPAEYVIARVMFRLRRPTLAEQSRIDQAWGPVSRAAGVPPDRYRLWVQDAGELNAFATSGHIVAVTRIALDRLPPQHLSAVLAHELGHHLGGHSWAALLTYWYSLPGRVAVRALFTTTRFLFAVVAGFTLGAAGGAIGGRAGGDAAGCLIGPLVRLLPWLILGTLTWFLYSIHPALVLVWAIPFLLAWASRWGERYADRVAADLGYGALLIEVLYGWLRAGEDDARRRDGLRASMFATHPSHAARIQALEKHLYGRTYP